MNNYIEHHGILGQKWGVRKYQNKDGSLTTAGKKRYSTGYAVAGEAIAKVENAKNAITSNPEKYRSATNQLDQSFSTFERISAKNSRIKQMQKAKTLTNKELQDEITRRNLERQYADLTAIPSFIEKGSSYTREILQTTGAALGIALTIKTLKKH